MNIEVDWWKIHVYKGEDDYYHYWLEGWNKTYIDPVAIYKEFERVGYLTQQDAPCEAIRYANERKALRECYANQGQDEQGKVFLLDG